MHITDGILHPATCAGGMVVCGVAFVGGARRFDEERVPELGVVTSILFVASLVHVPLGITSVHLLLNSLAGMLLGWLSLPALLVALFLQYLLFGHGGLTTIGVNTCIAGSGAVAAWSVFRGLVRLGRSRPPTARRAGACGFVATLAGIGASGTTFSLVMYTAGEEIGAVGLATFAAHLPVAVIEGIVTAGALSFLTRVKPELLYKSVSEGTAR